MTLDKLFLFLVTHLFASEQSCSGLTRKESTVRCSKLLFRKVIQISVFLSEVLLWACLCGSVPAANVLLMLQDILIFSGLF